MVDTPHKPIHGPADGQHRKMEVDAAFHEISSIIVDMVNHLQKVSEMGDVSARAAKVAEAFKHVEAKHDGKPA